MPKNIVLLSDGTGNSAGKLFKTNVWRVFQALDPRDPDTRVIYDDGVGTDHFAPTALLGGAVGLGLAKNVRDLYAFLCRNYEPDDRIYAFGFSRGAFTIRTLVALVTSLGIIDEPNEAALQDKVRAAYKQHRKQFKTNWGLLYDKLRRRDSNAQCAPEPLGVIPDIRFLGLWDTVAAYGLPIDELQRGIDRYFRALTFPDRDLSPKVQRARHALSIDDERRTFHPVLWNENGEKDPQRIQQVWFAGVHSDVGGGYPKESLSYVPLVWIMQEAVLAGLRFRPGVVDEYTQLADPHGDLHDSRSGLAAYYRYAPRNIATLCNDDYAKVHVARPKIHESVFKRIKDGRVAYAPTGIPADYDILSNDGVVVPGPQLLQANGETLYESQVQARARVGVQGEPGAEDRAWDSIWHRRVLYFGTLGASLFLVLLPALFRSAPHCEGAFCVFSSHLIQPLGMLLPDWLGTWIDAFSAHPGSALAGAGALTASMLLSARVAANIRDNAENAWHHLKARRPTKSHYSPGLVYRLRSSQLLVAPYLWFARSVLPSLFALALAASAFLVLNHALFASASAVSMDCSPSQAPVAVGDQPVKLEFDLANPCFATGLEVERGARYQLQFEREASASAGWQASLLRRVLAQPWAQPLVKVGPHVDPLASARFKPRARGELFVFVNDAVLALPGLWSYFYGDNQGKAWITVSRVPAKRGDGASDGVVARGAQ